MARDFRSTALTALIVTFGSLMGGAHAQLRSVPTAPTPHVGAPPPVAPPSTLPAPTAPTVTMPTPLPTAPAPAIQPPRPAQAIGSAMKDRCTLPTGHEACRTHGAADGGGDSDDRCDCRKDNCYWLRRPDGLTERVCQKAR